MALKGKGHILTDRKIDVSESGLSHFSATATLLSENAFSSVTYFDYLVPHPKSLPLLRRVHRSKDKLSLC